MAGTRLARLLSAIVVVTSLVLAAPMPVAADHVTFGEPAAEAVLGGPISFRTPLKSAEEPQNVELLLQLPGERTLTVLPADVQRAPDGWQAEAMLEGHVAPNTRFSYRFRVRHAAEGATLGPQAEVVLRDDRVAWRTIEGPLIRVHWYEGDENFARRALEIGEDAVEKASGLLGVTETEPIDFFIYASETDLRMALGPGTRENVGGQAHADIRTLFGLIEPGQVNDAWVDTLVAHELTHLVFDTATDNPYHAPPRWLNEGVAVLLSEGYTAEWQSVIEAAAADASLIPLQGLGGLFPTTGQQFRLAYAESVAAVDHFIRIHDEPTLWRLVAGYAEGVSDDEAFRRATGDDLEAFNAGWMESLGVPVPQPFGPQPGEPGPVPPGWQTEPGVAPTLSPIDSPALGTTPGVVSTPPAGGAPDATTPPGRPAGDDGTAAVDALPALVIGAGLGVLLVVVFAVLLVRRRLLP